MLVHLTVYRLSKKYSYVLFTCKCSPGKYLRKFDSLCLLTAVIMPTFMGVSKVTEEAT